MRAVAVIGAGFGDEGKGHIVDFLSSPKSVVVRFNGGAQAGHTVVAEGKRHVFHSFGSGTLRGAETFLSEHFILNPPMFQREWEELRDMDLRPRVHISPFANVTTPFDMLVNRWVERHRKEKHGSCGLGINETVVRSEIPGYGLQAWELGLTKNIVSILERIRPYSLGRYVGLTGETPPMEFLETLWSEETIASFLQAAAGVGRFVGEEGGLVLDVEDVIFEGAQGLLLDQGHDFFPFVTRSNTGLRNVVAICREEGIKELEVVFVLRTYLTRHGPGPFPTEQLGRTIEDTTNGGNEFQGPLRIGEVDYALVAQGIRKTLADASGLRVHPSLAVTHYTGKVEDEEVVRKLKEATGLGVRFLSSGPGREQIRELT